MVNKSKDIGTHAETGVARYIRAHGFGDAERIVMHGREDEGDIGTFGVTWSIKGGEMARKASDVTVAHWLAEVEKQRRYRGAIVGCIVYARRGYAPARAGHWWVAVTADTLAELWVATEPQQVIPDLSDLVLRMTLADWCVILRAAGYGDPL